MPAVTVGEPITGEDLLGPVSFPDLQHGFATVRGQTSSAFYSIGVADSTDGGAHWTVMATPATFAPDESLTGVEFVDDLRGVAWGTSPATGSVAQGQNLFRDQ